MSEDRKKMVDKIIKDVKSQKCAWQGCNKDRFLTINLQVVKQGEKGLEQIPNTGVPVSFCNYHFAIAQSGLCLGLQTEQGVQMIAPIDMVKVAEAVLGGFVFSGQLEELMKHKKKADDIAEQRKKHEEEKNEEIKSEYKGNESVNKPSDE